MTMENSVSFKVFLQKGESIDQPEVRRFGIDRDVVSNFGYLTEKLKAVFPSLSGKNFVVHWKDADGDNIMITSDEELMIALSEMQTDVHKLYVVVKPPSEQQQQQQPQDGSAYPVHTGVTCDGCGKAVQGFRYKCVQCPDYDLCANCENANLHGEHFMIRVPVPISWRPYFGRRLAHHLSKSARKGGLPCENNWGSESQDGGACPAPPAGCPYSPRGSHGRHRGPHGHHPGWGGHNWLETLCSYLSEWTNLPGEAETPQAAANPPTEATQQPTQQRDQQHINYLRTVGQTVAHLLDPLGIDVDIEVRSKNDTGEKVTKSNEENKTKTDKENIPGNKNVTFAGTTAHETVVKEVASQIHDLTIHDNKAESNHRGDMTEAESSSGKERTSPEADGWTVVTGMETQQTVSPPTVTAPTVANNGAFSPFSSPVVGLPVAMESSFYETAHQAAMLGAQQAMAAHEASMQGVPQADHGAVHRAAHERAVLAAQQAQEVARRAAHERAKWEAQQAMAASGNNNSIYPNLAAQPPVPQFPQQPQPISHHPQRHIAEAVEQMMSMGFTNEGGWLTQLIANQNGNITKVLDILQPVKK